MKHLYTAEATATGDGRAGHVTSPDGTISADLRVPVEMGGPGGAPNPEVLFAAGYAACFHGSLQLAARMSKILIAGSSVTAQVTIGSTENGAYQLAVTLIADIPSLDPSTANELMQAAHSICPYSSATRGNIEVTLTLGTA